MSMGSVDFLLQKIISLLENEAALLGGIHDELEEIKRELVSMRSFLEDADRKGAQSEGEKTWVASVRDIAYDVEDIIDEFQYHVSRKQGWGERQKIIYQTVRLPKDLWDRHQIVSKLESIKAVIKAIPERRQRYSINNTDFMSSSSSSSSHGNNHRPCEEYHAESSLFLKDDDLVGIEDETQLLVGWLTEGASQRTTISVVGMGGSGKTTLAAKAYNSQTVKRHFDCYAWITVSQTYVIEDLFRSMIKEFYKATKEAVPMDLSTMRYKELVEMLVDYLEPKRYIVVLDDVWILNLWNEIKVSLPNGRHGSRVMLTTRKEDIASLSYDVGGHVHHIKPLEKDEAWSLFSMKAFSRNGNQCPPGLKTLAADIVERCSGLPLAIVALGGLMSSKKLESEWKVVHNSLNWELSNNKMLQVVKSILLLSYNDLPYRLKRCFLYCCVFPEDYLIRRKRLIRLWMAEGFLEQVRGVTPEEVAESYLVELIRRSMLQVVERNSSGRAKACKMHDLLRELALSISKEEKFFSVYDEHEAKDQGVPRRLSIQTSEREIRLSGGLSQLRSFFLFVVDIFSTTPSSMNRLPSGFKLLRVLDLEDAPIQELPGDIIRLFNLRYLNLKRTQLKELPKSIGRLCNLQTLNIVETNVKTLPHGVTKLQNLRYLITCSLNREFYYDFDYIVGTKAPNDLSNLKNLQALGCIEGNSSILKQVENMTQLVRFDISNVESSDETSLCKSIQNMKLLRRLFVMASNEEEVLRMDALSAPPPQLQRLTLVGRLEKVPRWFQSLQNLRVLHLHWSRLIENPLPHLQSLPNLKSLVLVNTRKGPVLLFNEGFDNLEVLELHNFPNLQHVYITKGAMSNIKELHIGKCMQLKSLPGGIQYLSKLQELTLLNASKELIDSIRGEGSSDLSRVKHIPKISHVYLSSTGWSQESLS